MSEPVPEQREEVSSRQRLLDEFEAVLQADESLAASDRQIALRHYEQALEATPVQLGPPNLKDLRADFMEAVNRLAELDIIDRSESDQMVRDLTDALQPLDDTQLQISEEYVRRVREEGVESASAWLKSKTRSASDLGSASPSLGVRQSSAAAARSESRRRKR